MDINGPINLAIEEKSDGTGSAIHLSFTDIFRLLDLDKQKNVLDNYLDDLRKNIDIEMKERERQGMLMVQQVVEQLYPHIVAGEIDLDETMIIDIVQDSGINFNHFTGNI
ncbi:MAG TPA: hypothetical protein ENI67_05665 [Gammaproteobacteria bacterium]|nr:hypothetical protein [Gammaproteobacteria bacterium]